MKELKLEQMEPIEGGRTAFMIGFMCGATVLLAMTGVFAPLAGATGAGCITGLVALNYWDSQGLDINTI